MADENLKYGQLKAYENILQLTGDKKAITDFCLKEQKRIEKQLKIGEK